MTTVRIIASPSSWIEGSAVQQLERVAGRPGMVRGVGMPGLHPGKGCPVDAAFITEDIIFPDIVGSDIGCGMAFYATTIQQRRPERLEKKLKGLEGSMDDPEAFLIEHGVQPCGTEHALGTIGRGNHFVELQVIDEVFDTDWMTQRIPPGHDDHVFLLVHSGSRGFGEKILFDHAAKHQDGGLVHGTDDFCAYLKAHDHAVVWAEANRQAIARRVLDALDADGTRMFDICHNMVECAPADPVTVTDHFYGARWVKERYIHRKGSIPSDRGPVIIPGSRGALSYLVESTRHPEEHLACWSLSHGAGRKMSRREALQKNQNENSEKLTRTQLGSYVICEDKFLLREEAPNAYKNISQVIQDLVDAGLIRVLATLKPILTYKMRRVEGEADNWRERDNPRKYKRERHD